MEGNNGSTIELSTHLKDIIDRFESQDMSDLLEQMPEARFEVDMQPYKGYFRLEQSLAATLRQLARLRGISAETLLNLWVQEKLLTERLSTQNKQPSISNGITLEQLPADQLQMALA